MLRYGIIVLFLLSLWAYTDVFNAFPSRTASFVFSIKNSPFEYTKPHADTSLTEESPSFISSGEKFNSILVGKRIFDKSV